MAGLNIKESETNKPSSDVIEQSKTSEGGVINPETPKAEFPYFIIGLDSSPSHFCQDCGAQAVYGLKSKITGLTKKLCQRCAEFVKFKWNESH